MIQAIKLVRLYTSLVIVVLISVTCFGSTRAQSVDSCMSAGIKDALTICRSILDKGSRNADVYWKLSSALYQDGQQALARQTLNSAIQLHPGNSRLLALQEIISSETKELQLIALSVKPNQRSLDKAVLKISCLTKLGAEAISACKRRLELTDDDGDRMRFRLADLEDAQAAETMSSAPSPEPPGKRTLTENSTNSSAQIKNDTEVNAENAVDRLNDNLRANSIIERLRTAPAAYNRLTELWYLKPETVVYRVDLSSTSGPRLPASLKGESVTIKTAVTPEMSVSLIGSSGLDIEPKGNIKKRVSDAAPTSWTWKVTPVSTDVQFLTLTTYVHFLENEKSEPYTINQEL